MAQTLRDMSAPTRIAGTKVLIVDDEPINRRYLLELLGGQGVVCTAAADGPSAIALSATNRFELLLLDFRMPGMDGLATLEGIRAQPCGWHLNTPAIVLTAETQASEHARLLAGGFTRCVMKPARAEPLLRVIGEVLGRDLDANASDSIALYLDATVAMRAANGNVTIVATLQRLLLTELDTLAVALASASPMDLHRTRGACALTGATALAAALLTLEEARRAQLDETAALSRASALLAATQQALRQSGA
jgi:two-component system, NarL family, sensor histidine kinase BarA